MEVSRRAIGSRGAGKGRDQTEGLGDRTRAKGPRIIAAPKSQRACPSGKAEGALGIV